MAVSSTEGEKMRKIRIVINNFNYVVTLPSMQYKPIISYMLARLSTYGFRYDYRLKRAVRQLDKVYAGIIDHKLEYRFHINTLKNFMLTLGNNGIGKDMIDISRNGLFKPASLGLSINPEYILRPHQEDYESILLQDDGQVFKLVDLIMGGGKSLIAMSTVTKVNMRTMILVLPKFIEKWKGDVLELTNVKKEDIAVIQGGNKLTKIVNEFISGEAKYKFIIVSIRTIHNYIKAYENNTDEDEFEYPITPDMFLETMKVGVVVNDETHMEFHSVFRAALYFDTHRFIGLSATLEDNDRTQTKMYNIMFPEGARISGLLEHKPYVHVHAVRYELSDIKYINYKRPQGYSHNLYEQSILHNNIFLRGYLKMVEHYVKIGHMERKSKGDKCLVYVASVRMATLMANRFADLYPELDVRRYIEEDPYDNIMEADLTVTTVLSAGVALDIPNLTTLISTISVRSVKSVKQLYGRLRPIKGKEVRYYTLYSKTIPNQTSNYYGNKELLDPLAYSWALSSYDEVLQTR